MDITVAKSYLFFKKVFLLCLLCSLAVSACGSPAATLAPAVQPFPNPTIVPGRPCELAPGETIPLSVTGVPGTGVTYSWTASAGTVIPPDNSVVQYTAPDTGGDVIIKVVAQKDDQASEGMIICKVIAPPPVPTDTAPPATSAPTLPPTPVPTTWECTSYRPEKVQKGDIPGEVKIETPPQATIGLPSGQSVQVAGTYSGIPEGQYLWVFIFSQDAGLRGRYYPQTKDALQGWQPDPTTGEDARWSLNVNFGAPNLCYEVIILLGDATASQAIADQLENWAAVNNYTGYEMNGPSFADPPDPPGLPDGLVEKASIEVKVK